MTSKTRIITVSALLILLVATAFGVERYVASLPEPEYEVRVLRGDRTIRRFDLEDLQAMEVRRVVMQGKPEEGPALLAVLEAAGVEKGDFTVVSFTGMAIRDDGELTLKATEIDGDVLLDVAKHGTVKICGPHIVRDDRVRDVTEIRVQ